MMEACVCLYMNKSFMYLNDIVNEIDNWYFEGYILD